jgi:serine/threonine-protein kinase
MIGIGDRAPTGTPPQVGNFEVLGTLGRGGMAEVFLARRIGTPGHDRLAVLKRILPRYEATSRYRSMFIDEARLAALLHHPSICRAYEFCLQEGTYWLAMEFIDGRNLGEVQRRALERGQSIPIEVTLHVIGALCEGLHYAHERRDPRGAPLGIVHRDVNPQNVMIGFDGSVKLLDFGVAKAEGRRSETTVAGGLKGKVAYMSPEQCRGKDVDRRTDVFALGILLYELTTGVRLFDHQTDVATVNQIVNEPIPLPSARVPGFPLELEAILLQALSYAPDERFATASELEEALVGFAARRGVAQAAAATAALMSELFDRFSPPSLEAGDATETSAGRSSVGDLIVELVPEDDADETRVVIHRPAPPRRRWLPVLGITAAAAAVVAVVAVAASPSGDPSTGPVGRAIDDVAETELAEPERPAETGTPAEPASLPTTIPDAAFARDKTLTSRPDPTSARPSKRRDPGPRRAVRRGSSAGSKASVAEPATGEPKKIRKMIERSWDNP